MYFPTGCEGSVDPVRRKLTDLRSREQQTALGEMTRAFCL